VYILSWNLSGQCICTICCYFVKVEGLLFLFTCKCRWHEKRIIGMKVLHFTIHKGNHLKTLFTASILIIMRSKALPFFADSSQIFQSWSFSVFTIKLVPICTYLKICCNLLDNMYSVRTFIVDVA
jgi:hypothetical protein